MFVRMIVYFIIIFFVLLGKEKKPYWLEIKTEKPSCTYYFGPFDSCYEAKRMRSGFIDDLVAEKAEIISVKLTQSQPSQLTIVEEEEKEEVLL